MPSIPTPRTPKCYVHHIHLASCPDCMAQQKAEREAAKERLKALLR